MMCYSMKTYGGFRFPFCNDLSILGKKTAIAGNNVTLKNSISIHPLEGSDAQANGAPSSTTRHKYTRFAASGAALVWFESLAVQEDGRSSESALWITKQNLDGYKKLIEDIKHVDPSIVVIAQLTHSGRFSKPRNKPEPVIATFNPHHDSRLPLPADYPIVSDEYLDRLEEQFVYAAKLCQQAGFDGVDIKACHGYLVSELLSAFTRHGRYDGSYENRTRFLRETIANVKATCGVKLLVASRYSYADTIPYPYGFGMSRDGLLDYDFSEPIQLLNDMHDAGVSLVDMSVGKVNVNLNYANRQLRTKPIESEVQYFNRFFTGTKIMHEACPDVTIIGSDYSALKGDAPFVAAGALASNSVSMVGFGRLALAYAGFAHAMMENRFDPRLACTNCGSCSKLLMHSIPSGCPVFDRDTYLPLLKSLDE